MMKWLLFAKQLLDLISKLPFNAPNEAEVEQHVRATLQDEATVQALDEAGVQSDANNWEEIIPHIVALIMFFLNRRSGANPGIPTSADNG